MPRDSSVRNVKGPTPIFNVGNHEIDGLVTIDKLGHREFVGGMWDEIGLLQFEFLKRNGIEPHHCLLDIACGCLRAGIHLIEYLDSGNYLGIDKEQVLIDRGIKSELGQATFDLKQPEFVVSSSFEFSKFGKLPDYSIAQSLFTHLTPTHIELCLANLGGWVQPGHVFFATFFQGDCDSNPLDSHSRLCFWYPVDQMSRFGSKYGWRAELIGDWNHPRNQQMIKYIAN